MIRLDEVLRNQTMEDLVSFQVERRVDRLAYSGFDDLCAELSERNGLDLCADESQREPARLAIEKRNLLVHARGVIRAPFKRRRPWFSGEVGERVLLNNDEVFADVDVFQSIAASADRRAIRQFGLGPCDHEHGMERIFGSIEALSRRLKDQEPPPR